MNGRLGADDPTLVGTVQDVRGGTVAVTLNANITAGPAFIDGHGYRFGQVGTFVRIPIGYVDLFGVVSQIGAGAVPERLQSSEPFGHRWMTVQLLGESHSRTEFKRGLSQYPTIGDPVHVVQNESLARIYGRDQAPNLVRIGHLASAEAIPALVDVNALVTRHSAVLGATGSGKSTTVAGLLASLSERDRFHSARIIVLDIHGEYAAALADRASVFRVNPRTQRSENALFIPYWALTFDEFSDLAFGPLADVERSAVLDKVSDLKSTALDTKPRVGVDQDSLTVDTPVPFSIHKLWFDLYRLVHATHTRAGGQSAETEALVLGDDGEPIQNGDAMQVIPPVYKPHSQAANQEKIYLSTSNLNIRRQIQALGSRLRDPRYHFIFRPGPWLPNEQGIPERDLDELVESWLGGPNPITILDLSGIPSAILQNLVGCVLRILFDVLFWSRDLAEGGRERPLLLVLEEAHAYLGEESSESTGPATRIVKEGRKYGIGMMIVSQRASEIHPTILSQCGTIIAMRLSNSVDRGHVTGIVSENLEGLLSMLPVLRTGEAIVVGEAVQLPVRTLIDPPGRGRRPDSSDPLVYTGVGAGGWNRKREPSAYQEVVLAWRRQEPRGLRQVEVEEMERHAVTSTNIASVGYEQDNHVLEIEFQSGAIYQYFDVPIHVYEALLAADSIGTFFNEQVRGVYRYARV